MSVGAGGEEVGGWIDVGVLGGECGGLSACV